MKAINVRLPDELHAWLKDAASANARSLQKEIVFRLEWHVRAEKQLAGVAQLEEHRTSPSGDSSTEGAGSEPASRSAGAKAEGRKAPGQRSTDRAAVPGATSKGAVSRLFENR